MSDTNPALAEEHHPQPVHQLVPNKVYDVIVNDEKKFRIVVWCVVSYFVLNFLLLIFVPQFTMNFFLWGMIALVLFSLFSRLLLRGICDKHIKIELFDRKMVIHEGCIHTIFYGEINKYNFGYDGRSWLAFTIFADSNRKIKLSVNTSFNHTQSLEAFAKDFDELMLARSFLNQLPQNSKSLHTHSAAYLILLVLMTAIFFYLGLDTYFNGKRLPPQAIFWIATVAGGWYSWFKNREGW
jgi:hypothetical protein